MGPFELSLVIAAIFTGVFFLMDLIPFRGSNQLPSFKAMLTGSLITGVILLLVLTGINFLVLYFGRPAMVGMYQGMTWLVLDLVVATAVFAVHGFIQGRLSLGILMGTILCVLLAMHACVQGVWTPRSNQDVDHLNSFINIEEVESGVYPETDADHILLVPQQTALFKARQVVSRERDNQGRNLSTIYKVGEPALQSINDHLYWAFQLSFSGWLASNQVEGRVSPGYIVVDAEDPSADPQVKLGYEMRYIKNSYFANNLERHVYNNGYRNRMIDDLTLEIRDDWEPFYTASLNRNVLRYRGSIPETMVIIDPQTGEITEYDLDEIPDWVDRVYSESVVNELLSWWGHWGKAEWKLLFERAPGRMKPADEPTLVYTKGGHPAWQVMMTSWNEDTSVIAVVLFDGRSNTAKVYDVSGIAIEEAVLKAFRTTNKNLKNFQPVHPSIHKIYGELTWVVSYISEDTNGDGAEPFQGIGLLQADRVDGASVVMADFKSQAFAEYRQLLARGNTNADPEEGGITGLMIEGVVTNVATAVINGNTNYYIMLDSDPDHVFQGTISDNLDLPFVRVGARVQITYLDVGNRQVDIISYVQLEPPKVPRIPEWTTNEDKG